MIRPQSRSAVGARCLRHVAASMFVVGVVVVGLPGTASADSTDDAGASTSSSDTRADTRARTRAVDRVSAPAPDTEVRRDAWKRRLEDRSGRVSGSAGSTEAAAGAHADTADGPGDVTGTARLDRAAVRWRQAERLRSEDSEATTDPRAALSLTRSEHLAARSVDAVAESAMPSAVAPQSQVTSVAPAVRPVNLNTIAVDTLTWIGLGPLARDLPVPAIPVPRIVEMLWLEVRRVQYTWNNQRPTAQPTLSQPIGDGLVHGELNAVDFEGDRLTYIVSTGPKYGTVVIDADGHFTYTPNGPVPVAGDTFTVTIDDVPGNPARVHGLAGLLGLSGPTTATVTVTFTSAAINDVGVTRPGAVSVQMDADGRISVINGTFTEARVFDAADAALVLNAMAGVLGAETGFAAADLISVERVVWSSGGVTFTEEFYRLRERVDGLDVVGSEVVLVTDGYGTITGLFNNHDARIADVDTTPAITGQSAAASAAAALSQLMGLQPDSAAAARALQGTSVNTRLVVFALDEGEPSLAWRVDIAPPADARGNAALAGATYYVRANGERAGEVLVGTSTIQPADVQTSVVATDLRGVSRTIAVTRSSFLFFQSHSLDDRIRRIVTYQTSYSWFGLGGPELPGKVVRRSLLFGWGAAGVSAHANMAAVYDYYATVLGRNSFDGAGATVITSLGYNPRTSFEQYFSGYANAFWSASAQQFAFGSVGQFEAALDVVAHEFTHGVISHIVGGGGSVLDYGESGALNEAYADILGVLIEGKTGSGEWLIGEDTADGPIRSLAFPAAISTSYRMHYDFRYTGTADDGGEHWNSTIFSHAAYRMITDPDTAQISRDTWARVFYHSLYRLSPGATFVDGRAAIMDTAAEFGFTAAELQAIADAFDAVGIYLPPIVYGPDALLLVVGSDALPIWV